ncbi:MAG: trehalose-6-phosphate synthase [Burkholderiaceae bacterium]
MDMQERVVIVANRTPAANSAGGLASGLLDALKKQPSLWFGWSGELRDEGSHTVQLFSRNRLTVAAIPLSPEAHNRYYNGFANGVLWPAFHHRLDLMCFTDDDYLGYLEVNRLMAKQLRPLLQPRDLIWVHDYHLLPFAGMCRQLGITQRMGFFLHIPFPVPSVAQAIPRIDELLDAMCGYDLLGFQTEDDRSAFVNLCRERRPQKPVPRTGVYPIGVDPHALQLEAQAEPVVRLWPDDGSIRGILSVDRLDYTKGLPERFKAYALLLEEHPELRGEVQLVQIAPPSRTDVPAYVDLRHELTALAGEILGRYGHLDWQPLIYVERQHDRAVLMPLYRQARVGLVTPLRDGMNLVAKEFVAAQNPEDPGVLVLSRFAGAACQLDGALLVNPHDPGEMAEALRQALGMPLHERRARYQRMWAVLCASDIEGWRKRYLADLRLLRDRAGQAMSVSAPTAPARRRALPEQDDSLLLKEHPEIR